MTRARIFYAGVGTTFVFLVIGFGGGVLLAKSVLKDNGSEATQTSQLVPVVRVVLPASNEPAPQVTADPPKPQLISEQLPPKAESTPDPSHAYAQAHENQKTNRRLWAEKRRERAERRAQRRARKYQAPQRQQEPARMAFDIFG